MIPSILEVEKKLFRSTMDLDRKVAGSPDRDHKIASLFEIHITVDHTLPRAFFLLHDFTTRYPTVKKVFAVSSDGTDQYMLTKWKNG